MRLSDVSHRRIGLWFLWMRLWWNTALLPWVYPSIMVLCLMVLALVTLMLADLWHVHEYGAPLFMFLHKFWWARFK